MQVNMGLDNMVLKEKWVEEMRKILAKAELAFEEKIALYPFKIKMVLIKADDEPSILFMDEIKKIEKWLKRNIKGGYISFPDDAIGKFKGHWQYCFFKYEEDAILFKLTWG